MTSISPLHDFCQDGFLMGNCYLQEYRIVNLMRGLPITCVRKREMEGWKNQLEEYRNTIITATEFVNAIEKGKLDVTYGKEDHNQFNSLADLAAEDEGRDEEDR